MPATILSTTSNATLEIRWEESSSQGIIGVQLGHITDELQNLGLIVNLSLAIALELKPTSSAYERALTLDTKVRRVHFGSPLLVDLQLAREVIESAAAITFLIFALKRAWGIDLELKAHREEMRYRFIEAKQKADQAQDRVDQAYADLKVDRSVTATVYDQLNEELGWGADAASASQITRKFWTGARATLHLDDED